MRSWLFTLCSISTGVAIYSFAFWGNARFWFDLPSLSIEIIIINVVVTSLIYWWLARVKAPDRFINSYLLSIVLKLFFYTSLLLGVRLVAPNALALNAVFLIVCYLLFTVLEVMVLFVKVNR